MPSDPRSPCAAERRAFLAQVNAQPWSHHNRNRDLNAGVKQIKQEILAIDIVDIALICVGPTDWPGIDDREPVAGILEAGLAIHNGCLVDNKRVLTSEVGAELVVRNSATLAVGTLRLLRLLGRFGVFLICRLVRVSRRLNLVLFWRFRIVLLLARRCGFIVRRLGCFGARFFLRRLGIVLRVLRVDQTATSEKGNQNEHPDYSDEFHSFYLLDDPR